MRVARFENYVRRCRKCGNFFRTKIKGSKICECCNNRCYPSFHYIP